jgi:hypothetical protein
MPGNDTPSAGVTWKELAARARTFRLEIAFRFETTDPRAIAEQLGDLAFSAIAHATPDEAGRIAQEAVHYAELAYQGRLFVGTAVLDGGPPRARHARDDYRHAFRVLVHQAIKLAGFVLREEEEAFQVWSERLRREQHSLKLGTIEDAGEATALLCEHFSAIAGADVRREFSFALGDAESAQDANLNVTTRAVSTGAVDASAPERAIVPDKSEPRDEAIPATSEVAVWLAAALTVRGWDERDLQRNGGPNWKTTRKMLNRERVKGVIFDRVKKGLNAAKDKPTVTDEEIEGLKAWRWRPRIHRGPNSTATGQ